jgi:protease II
MWLLQFITYSCIGIYRIYRIYRIYPAFVLKAIMISPSLYNVITLRCMTGSTITSESRYLSADQPGGSFKVILPRVTDVEYSVSHHPGSSSSSSSDGVGGWFVMTFRTAELPNSELRVAPVDSPEQQTVSVGADMHVV